MSRVHGEHVRCRKPAAGAIRKRGKLTLMKRNSTILLASAGLLFWVAALGCGGGANDANKADVRGTATFRGTPIPIGRIEFLPDESQGNSGSAGYAMIERGAFDTQDNGRGPVAGKLVVRISGFDGKSRPAEELEYGNALFEPYQTTIEAAAGEQQMDFRVP